MYSKKKQEARMGLFAGSQWPVDLPGLRRHPEIEKKGATPSGSITGASVYRGCLEEDV